jgi:PAS domain S-box-containing protein
VAQGRAIGKFMTYYETPRSFAAHEIELAVTIARQVGFSIERARSERARLAAEHELRESEERFRLMSEHAPVMIWMSDENGKCLHLNKMQRDFWGVSEENLGEFDRSSTMHPEDAPETGRTIMEAMFKRTSVDLKGRFRDTLGRWRVLQTVARPRMSNAEFLGMIGVNIDVTEREEAEAARRTAETPRQLEICWREQGGPAVAPPTRTGFGSVLLQRSLKGDLNADVTLDFDPAGLVCIIRASLAPDPHS